MTNDTIFALSSATGKSGVAVIRISGRSLYSDFLKIISKDSAEPRRAYFAKMRDTNNDLIDEIIAIYFAAPNSFTGEDIIEIHSHGAVSVIKKIFEELTQSGARLAQPGEFSRRAFYNNKMDLSDVDGLAALLDAQTDKQRRSALESMTGRDSYTYENWRAQMIEISAFAAAMLDYAEDELPANIGNNLYRRTTDLHQEISRALNQYSSVRAIRGGFNIVLAGETNVGKSSIFNKLVGSNRAIVSDIAGTTRDIVSAQLDIDGYLVNLSDTAGIRESDDVIENIGIQKTHSEIEKADLTLRVYAQNPADTDISDNELLVINKSDKLSEQTIPNAIYTSALKDAGIDNLLSSIKEKMHKFMDNSESQVAVNARTYGLLNDTKFELKTALETDQNNYDLFAEHLRRASDNIGKILGTITASEVMDATFSGLCLGK